MEQTNNLRVLRQGRGLTIQGLAAVCRCSPSSIVFVEAYDHIPGPDLRRRLAGALGVSEHDVWPGVSKVEERQHV